MNGPAPSRVEIPLAEKEIDLDDFVFESESENQSINPSNAYAADETIRLKGKDDKSPLVKLRNNPIDLGDDASEYDRYGFSEYFRSYQGCFCHNIWHDSHHLSKQAFDI